MAKRSSALKHGSKIAEFFAFIKREMVGAELIITSEQMRQLMESLKVGKVETLYGMLQQMERKGLINRARRKGVKGIVVSFPTPGSEAESLQSTQKRTRRQSRSKRSEKRSKRSRGADKASPTLDDLISGLAKEIEGLKGKLDSRTKLYEQLVAARAELKRR